MNDATFWADAPGKLVARYSEEKNAINNVLFKHVGGLRPEVYYPY